EGLSQYSRSRVPQSQHLRHRRPVQVDVEEAHLLALGGKRHRQVHSYGALAHSTLAGEHDDLVLDLAHPLIDGVGALLQGLVTTFHVIRSLSLTSLLE